MTEKRATLKVLHELGEKTLQLPLKTVPGTFMPLVSGGAAWHSAPPPPALLMGNASEGAEGGGEPKALQAREALAMSVEKGDP